MFDGYESKRQIEDSLGSYVARNTEEGLRDALAHVIGIYALLRGDNQRMLELSDLHSLVWDGEGASDMTCVVMLLREGKTNKEGKVQYAAFARNKNVFLCGVSLMALYFFARYDQFLTVNTDCMSTDCMSHRFQ